MKSEVKKLLIPNAPYLPFVYSDGKTLRKNKIKTFVRATKY